MTNLSTSLDSKITNPSGWTAWQYLKKTAQWEEWSNVDALPSWWTEWQVLTKTQSWADWEDPTGWIQLAPNSPLKPKYNWYWTEAQYQALSQYYTDEPEDTVYHTI